MLLIEIPVAVLLGLLLSVRGWGLADERSGAPAMDWVPVLWLGGFTLGVLVVAVVFLRHRSTRRTAAAAQNAETPVSARPMTSFWIWLVPS